MKETLRIRQASPKRFSKIREKNLTEGVSAAIGITKEGRTQVQSFIFDKSKFNLQEAKNWVKEHNSKLKENFNTSYLSMTYDCSVEGASKLPNSMNNTKDTFVPNDITEIYPDVMYANGRINKEQVAVRLNDVKSMEKFITPESFKKIKKMLVGLLKESHEEMIRTSGFNLLEGEDSFTADDFDIAIKEATHDSSVRKARVILIKSGESKNGNIYSGKCLREATALFDGLPIYPNHSDSKRKVEEKVGFYSDPVFVGDDDNGEIHAIANILESEKKMWDLIKEQHNHPKAKLCGFSISAFGKGRVLSEANGKSKRIIDTIISANSTDIVSNPSAGGKVLELLESVKNSYNGNNQETSIGEEIMDEKTLREKFPDLVKVIEDSAKALALKEAEPVKSTCTDCKKEFVAKDDEKVCSGCAKSETEKVKEEVVKLSTEKNDLLTKLTESEEKIKTLQKDVYVVKLTESVTLKLSDSKFKALPGAAKERLISTLISLGEEKREGEQPSNWDLKIKEETDYVNKCRGPKDQLVFASETNETKTDKSKETVKLSEEDQRVIANSVSKVIF